MNIPSPVNNKTNTKLKTSIRAEKIIELYKKDLQIDIGRFFAGVNRIEIHECIKTGYLFYYPFNITGDEHFYDSLKKQFPLIYNSTYYSDWKWEYDICLRYINTSDRVYEIGCGHGNFLKRLKELGIDKVSGTELNEDSVRIAQSNGLDVEYITIQEKSIQVQNYYDVVCAFQVLEHVADVKSFIDACLSVLKPNGKLLIAVPYNSPYLFGYDSLNTLNLPPHHMGLWGKDAFRNLSKFFPLKLERLIIEKLPSTGYDFEQSYKVNKDIIYPPNWPLKILFDKFYFKWRRKYHKLYTGKNIIGVFEKND